MKVNIIKIAIVNKKKTITEFFKDRLNKIFISIIYKLLKKNQLILVRLLGFEPRTSWSVAKAYPVELQALKAILVEECLK